MARYTWELRLSYLYSGCSLSFINLSHCAHFVLKPTSFQLIPAYSSQISSFEETLAGVGLNEFE
jgi:hypothetical protein